MHLELETRAKWLILGREKKTFSSYCVQVKRKFFDKDFGTKNCNEIDENKLNSYLLLIGERLKNVEPIQLDGKKRSWWAIIKFDYWVKLSSLTYHRLHLQDKFVVPDFMNKQEELDIHAPQGALHKTNDEREKNEIRG